MARFPSPDTVNWSEGLQEVPKYINTVTNGIVLNLILFAIAFIVGSSYWFVRRDFPGALAVGCFVAWVFGLFGWIAEYVGNWSFTFLTAAMIGTALYVIVSTDQG